MAVLTYVVIGAIVNLCAGFICGLLMVRNRAAQCSTISTGRLAARARALTQSTLPAGRLVATGSATPQAATQDETAGGGASHDSSGGPHAARNAGRPASVSQTWSDFHQQLEQVQNRLGYARSVADKRLAVDVAGQLDACARSCYAQLQQCLDRECSHPGSPGIDPGETAAIEMFLSQLESTLTNIESLDRGEPTERFLAELDRQATLLRAYQGRAVGLEKQRDARHASRDGG